MTLEGVFVLKRELFKKDLFQSHSSILSDGKNLGVNVHQFTWVRKN